MSVAALADTVLAKADPADIRLAPFPHLVIPDALDAAAYAELAACRPGYAEIAGPPPHPSNTRMPCSAWLFQQLPHLPEPWQRFTARHTRPDILAAVRDLFRAHWPAQLPTRLPQDPARYGLFGRDSHDTFEILLDARLEVNAPVTGPASTHRGPHVDTPNRLFSMLFYLRAPEDDSVGGDLVLYRWRGARAANLDVFELDPDLVAPAATVPYAANTVVIFPNAPDALHGVSHRHPTPHERAYVFITAEVAGDLF